MLAGPAWRPCPESPDSLGEAGQGRGSRCQDSNPRTLRGEAKASSPGPHFQGDKQVVSCLILAWIMASSPSQQPIPPRWCLEFTCPLPCPPYLPVGSPGTGGRVSCVHVPCKLGSESGWAKPSLPGGPHPVSLPHLSPTLDLWDSSSQAGRRGLGSDTCVPGGRGAASRGHP